eukprot:3082494-Pyramimonas_sp.AAC.1
MCIRDSPWSLRKAKRSTCRNTRETPTAGLEGEAPPFRHRQHNPQESPCGASPAGAVWPRAGISKWGPLQKPR